MKKKTKKKTRKPEHKTRALDRKPTNCSEFT